MINGGIEDDWTLERDEINPFKRVRSFVRDRQQVAPDAVSEVSRRGADGPEPEVPNIAELRLRALQQMRAMQAQAQSTAKPGKSQKRGPLPAPNEAGGYWLPLGPFGSRLGQGANHPVISGRVSRIAISPDGQRTYLATANSGVWRSDDLGDTWVPLMGPDFDQNPTAIASDSLACGAIAVVQDPVSKLDIIYVGTGEGDSADGSSGQSSGYFGVGAIILRPNAAQWDIERVKAGDPALLGAAFFEMAVHPSQHNLVIAATTAGVYRRQETAPGSGIYEWAKLSNFILAPGTAPQAPIISSSVVVAQNAGVVTFFAFAALPLLGGVARRGIFTSTDNGGTWALMPTTGLPNQTHIARVRLAVQPNNPNVIYAQIPATSSASRVKRGHLIGVYRFETGDNRWHKIDDIPRTLFGSDLTEFGQGNYDNAIAVDPLEVNRIFIGGSTVSSNAAGRISNSSNAEWSASLYRCEITVKRNSGGAIQSVKAQARYIGGSVHADVHCIVFPPSDAGQLWVGCDGGVFHTRRPRNSGMIFRSCNHGLQTLTMQGLGLHPSGRSVLFCGTQDNGAQLYTGHEVWEVIADGDAGYCAVNWDAPRQAVNTYVNADIRRSTQFGRRGTYTSRDLGDKQVLFYAPLVAPILRTVPVSNAEKVLARHLAFGSRRLWLSTNFGGSWAPILGNTTSEIGAIAFASGTKIYIGNGAGEVYRYEKTGSTWRRALMSAGSASITVTGVLPGNAIRSIAIDLNDPSGDGIYVALGGTVAGNNNVWHGKFTPGPPITVNWTPKGGTTPGKTLVSIHHNAIVVDPANPKKLYVANDLGVWHTPDATIAGIQWDVFSQGLPDAAVLDLKLNGRRLLAATHGRGIFERDLDYTGIPIPVRLYVRNMPFDYGERHQTTLAGLTSPIDPAQSLQIRNSPDIRVQAPSANGSFRMGQTPDFIELGEFADDGQRVPVHASPQLYSKVYVSVHNNGTQAATDPKVVLLVAETTAAMPALPADHGAQLLNPATAVLGAWKVVGRQTVRKVRIGTPQVVVFDLPSNLLPPPGALTPSTRCCLMAILHHPQDAYQPHQTGGSAETNPEIIATRHRQVALREIQLVAFTGTLPPSIPVLTSKGYVAIPPSATAANAPVDALLGMAMRDNDEFFQQNIQQLLLAPFANNSVNNDIVFDANTGAPLDANLLLSVKKIDVAANITAGNAPLIWCAQESITLKATIDASGKGAVANQPGDFGGGGGGSATLAGPVCQMPVSAIKLVDGGAVNSDGAPSTKKAASRALTCLAFCKGGAGGANDGAALGGAGGGVVVLCAPVIRFEAGANIDVSGKKGASGNAGGGGGGLIILIANELVGYNENTHTKISGGAKSGTSGIGGTGFVLKLGY